MPDRAVDAIGVLVVQILPACGPNIYQMIYGEILDFLCQHANIGS